MVPAVQLHHSNPHCHLRPRGFIIQRLCSTRIPTVLSCIERISLISRDSCPISADGCGYFSIMVICSLRRHVQHTICEQYIRGGINRRSRCPVKIDSTVVIPPITVPICCIIQAGNSISRTSLDSAPNCPRSTIIGVSKILEAQIFCQFLCRI